MRRRDFLYGLSGGVAGVLVGPELPHFMTVLAAEKQRGLRICVDKNASPAIQRAAHSIAAAADHHPLLKTMAESGSPAIADSRTILSGSATDLAYNHLILVGLPDDALITAAWQREALPNQNGIYIFGFGHLRGDIGYLESDRNPFLHAAIIPSAPFETEVITLTGTTPAGVELAVQSFLEKELVNGVVARSGWSRPSLSLLDRDPLPDTFAMPALAAPRIGDYRCIALMQASEDEYRGVLADTELEPREIWRAKYYKEGGWDGVGAAAAFNNYAAGLHRRSYGNTLWLAAFQNSGQASTAAPKIAVSAGLTKSGNQWAGVQPPYATGSYPGEKSSSGILTLWQQNEWLLMSTFQMS